MGRIRIQVVRFGVPHQISGLLEVTGDALSDLVCDGVDGLLGWRFDRVEGRVFAEGPVNREDMEMWWCGIPIQIQSRSECRTNCALHQRDSTCLRTRFDAQSGPLDIVATDHPVYNAQHLGHDLWLRRKQVGPPPERS